MMRFIVALAIAMCGLSTATSAQTLLMPSVWQNQRGSIMKITATDPSNGAFTGVYINNGDGIGFRCQSTPYDVSGRVRGTRVAFRVVWRNFVEDCHSTTVWSGRATGGIMATRWILKNDGGGTVRGRDTFQRQ